MCDDVEHSRRVRERTREMRERELLGAVWVRSEWSEKGEDGQRSEERSGGGEEEVMQLRCVFLGRSGVGKSHVVNSLLRRACVPKRVKVEEEENEDEDENASGYEIRERKRTTTNAARMLQSPGKKKNVGDDIDAMVLDVAQAVNGEGMQLLPMIQTRTRRALCATNRTI